MNKRIGSAWFPRRHLKVICAVLLWTCAATGTTSAEEPRNSVKSIQQIVAEAHSGVEYISQAALKKRIAASDRVVLLDVRTQVEFDAGHMKGATWVERGIAEFMLVRQLPDPDAEIVVYCKVGNRTGLVVKALKNAGYRNVVGLEGGFDEWARQGNSVHNYLGEFKLVSLTKRDASMPTLDFYQDKTGGENSK
jgi:rhodanese-related sulfurtransferase